MSPTLSIATVVTIRPAIAGWAAALAKDLREQDRPSFRVGGST